MLTLVFEALIHLKHSHVSDNLDHAPFQQQLTLCPSLFSICILSLEMGCSIL